MAVKLERKTPRDKLLKVVSSTDSAIDWEKSFPGAELTEKGKRDEYDERHELDKLVFKDGDHPTVFVFDHPARADVCESLRGAFAAQASGRGGSDLYNAVFNDAFLGTQEGFDGVMNKPLKRNGKLTPEYLQALLDAGVFEELATTFIRVFRDTRMDATAPGK